MTKTAIIVLSILFSTFSFAGSLKSESDVRSYSDQIMQKVASGDLAAAFKLMKTYVVISETELDSSLLKSQALREQYGQRYGEPIGFEYIGKIKRGDSLLYLQYIEKTSRHAIPWSFYFYKAPGGWLLNSFNWKDQYQHLFTTDYDL